MMHYEAAHRFACSICNLSLPSPRYLDIHLREVHDNFFLAHVRKTTNVRMFNRKLSI